MVIKPMNTNATVVPTVTKPVEKHVDNATAKSSAPPATPAPAAPVMNKTVVNNTPVKENDKPLSKEDFDKSEARKSNATVNITISNPKTTTSAAAPAKPSNIHTKHEVPSHQV